MGWIQKLCDVYDVVSLADIPEEANHPQLARVGFVKKKVNYVVMISEDGAFSSAGALGKDDCECIVPSTPQAESRTSTKGAPYPLAENLKYLAEEKGSTTRCSTCISTSSRTGAPSPRRPSASGRCSPICEGARFWTTCAATCPARSSCTRMKARRILAVRTPGRWSALAWRTALPAKCACGSEGRAGQLVGLFRAHAGWRRGALLRDGRNASDP